LLEHVVSIFTHDQTVVLQKLLVGVVAALPVPTTVGSVATRA